MRSVQMKTDERRQMDCVRENLKKIINPYYKLMEKGNVKFLKQLLNDSLGRRLIWEFFTSEGYERTLEALKEEEKVTWMSLVRKYGL